jgi:hypothetical protein
MSDTDKEGKRGRGRPEVRPPTPQIGESMTSRHSYGRTEKILRRCRKIWTRLTNKRRRDLDKKIIGESNGS